MTGCLNLLFNEPFEPTVDHAPVLTNLQPLPSFDRITENVGANCAPQNTFRADRLDDADGDTLTVRWSMIVERAAGPVREILLEQDLDAADPPVNGVIYDFQPFQITLALLATLGDVADQADPAHTQLLELGVSDGGFRPGTEDVRVTGQTVLYMSWPFKLLDETCQ